MVRKEPAEPSLHERTVGRQKEIRQANRNDQQFENIEDRRVEIIWFPGGIRGDRGFPEKKKKKKKKKQNRRAAPPLLSYPPQKQPRKHKHTHPSVVFQKTTLTSTRPQ